NGILSYIATGNVTKSLSPTDIKNTVDPAHIGPNAAVLDVFNKVFPHGNDKTIGDGLNFIGYRFTPPVPSDYNTYIVKFDHRIDKEGKHQIFLRGNLQNDSTNGTPQFPGAPPNSVTLANNKGLATGLTSLLKNNIVSTFRYGFTRQGGETTGVQ